MVMLPGQCRQRLAAIFFTPCVLISMRLEALAAAEQEARYVVDVWKEAVARWLGGRRLDTWVSAYLHADARAIRPAVSDLGRPGWSSAPAASLKLPEMFKSGLVSVCVRPAWDNLRGPARGTADAI